jgi:hypothetical protein
MFKLALSLFLGTAVSVGLFVLGVKAQQRVDHVNALKELAAAAAAPHDAIGILQVNLDGTPVIFVFLDDQGRYASVAVGGCLTDKQCSSELNRLANANKVDEIAIWTRTHGSPKCYKLAIGCQPTQS